MRLEFIRFEKILQHRISCSEFERMEIKKFENDFDDGNGLKVPWEIATVIASSIGGFLFFTTTVFLACRLHPRKEKTADIELTQYPEDPEVVEPNQSLHQAQADLNLAIHQAQFVLSNEHEPSTWSLH